MPGSPPPISSVLGAFDRLVEVGIGERTALAADLTARGVSVTATDVTERSVPNGVHFAIDDVTTPELSIYEPADAIYALRLPPELQRPTADLAATVEVPLYVTTLGGDPVLVDAEPRTVQEGTLFVHHPDSDGPPSR